MKGVVVAEIDAEGRMVPDTEHGLNCDLLAVSGGSVPATSLLLQAGARARWDEAAPAYLPEDPPAGILAAGAVAGHESPVLAEASGALAGAEAAVSLGFGDEGESETDSRPSARCSPRRSGALARSVPAAQPGRRAPATSASPASARTSPARTSTTRSTRASTRSSC